MLGQDSDCVSFLNTQTGLPLSTYFAGVKLRWLLDNVKEVQDAHKNKTLAFGTVDSWLLYRLTGGLEGGVYQTDVTNASRTMFMNIKTLQWDDELLEFFDVDRSCLPEIVSNGERYGDIKYDNCVLNGVPIAGE